MNGQVTKIKHLTILDPFNVYESGSQWVLKQLNLFRISLTVVTAIIIIIIIIIILYSTTAP